MRLLTTKRRLRIAWAAVALFAHDELHIIRKKRNDRFKQPPLTTERG